MYYIRIIPAKLTARMSLDIHEIETAYRTQSHVTLSRYIDKTYFSTRLSALSCEESDDKQNRTARAAG
jgi:hypothetical protein